MSFEKFKTLNPVSKYAAGGPRKKDSCNNFKTLSSHARSMCHTCIASSDEDGCVQSRIRNALVARGVCNLAAIRSSMTP